MNPVEQLTRVPVAAVEFANLLLTRDDAQIGVTPKDVVWTHRKTTLYRYRSTRRTHAPVSYTHLTLPTTPYV